MNINDIIKLFPSKKISEDISSSSIIPIVGKVEYESGICDNGVDYYFKISLNSLLKSDLDYETIKKMSENGWVLSKNRKYIELIY